MEPKLINNKTFGVKAVEHRRSVPTPTRPWCQSCGKKAVSGGGAF